jgi:hypothetical protein
MADTVQVDTIHAGHRKQILRLLCKSDGTGESTVQKLDISSLTGPDGSAPTKTIIESIEGNVGVFSSIQLYWDATTDDPIAYLPTGYSFFDWREGGGLVDPQGSGTNGDIILTSVGAASTATYDITITLRLKD